MRAVPPVTQALIIVNVLIFLLQYASGDLRSQVGFLTQAFGLWTEPSEFRMWQIVTYGFLHGNQWHLLVNMFALFMFGSDVERVWGGRRYLIYYLVCVITAALAQLFVAALSSGSSVPVVGASGGVMGLLLAFGMLFPRRMVILLLPPIPMPAWLLVILYGAVELFSGVTGFSPGIAHFAHLGGMAGGYLLIQYWRGRLPVKPRR